MNTLADLLNIPPLSRVQINSTKTIRDFRIGDARPENDLPFWFFQRTVGELMEVRSPGGYAALVHPTDICDVVPAEPLVINAVPHALFIDWLGLPVSHRTRSIDPSLYRPARLLWVTKDRWNRVDGIFVQFIDETFNTRATLSAPRGRQDPKNAHRYRSPRPHASFQLQDGSISYRRHAPIARRPRGRKIDA
jgi:hypothetical protein